MDLATFLKHIDRERGRRSDQEISRAAGLPSNAMARLRADNTPSLERAARLADVVGLELVMRPKGEAIDPFALRVAVLMQLVLAPGGDEIGELADAAAARLERAYKPAEEMFGLVPAPRRKPALEAMQKMLVEKADKLYDERDKAIARRAYATEQAVADIVDEYVGGDPAVAAAEEEAVGATEAILGACTTIAGELAGIPTDDSGDDAADDTDDADQAAGATAGTGDEAPAT